MVTRINDYLTLQQIAEQEGVELHVARHALKRARIAPAVDVGRTFLYHATQLPQIREAITRTAKVRHVQEPVCA